MTAKLMKKLTKVAVSSPSASARSWTLWVSLITGTARSTTSSVIAMANKPSVKVSVRANSTLSRS